MSLGAELLMRSLGATQSPHYATEYNPDTKSFKYADGTSGTTPIKQPGYWNRFLNPSEADYVTGINTQYQQAPILAQQQKQLAIQRAMPAMQAMSGSKLPSDQLGNAADVMYGSGVIGNSGELNPDAYMNLGRQWNNAQAGISKPLSEADVLGAQNAAVGQYANKTYGVPQAQAYNSAAQNNLQGTIANGDLSSGYVPQLIANRLGGAQLEGAVTGQHLSDLPYTLPAMRNESIGGLIGSQYQPMGSYMGNRINEDGTVTPMSRNPYGGIPMMQTLGALQNGAITGGGPTIAGLVDKSGQPVSVKPTYNPIGGTVPTTSQPVDAGGIYNIKPQGQLTPIHSTPYFHDASGQVFASDGSHVTEEDLKGTNVEKSLKNQMDIEDKWRKSAALHQAPLPHGNVIGQGLIGTARDLYHTPLLPTQLIGNNASLADWAGLIPKAYHYVEGE